MRLAPWLLAAAFAPLAPAEECEVASYIARFELSEGSASADVTLDITYHVLSGEKSEGFKYVGDYEPANVRVMDEKGTPIPSGVHSRREYQIWWKFPPVGPGRKRVIVQFRLPGVLEGTRTEGNRVEADWAGVFGIPVRRAVYEVVFPPGVSPAVKDAKFRRTRAGSQEVWSWEQAPLERERLSVRFTPGFTDVVEEPMSGGSLLAPLGALGLAVVLIGFVIKYSGRGTGGGSADGGCGGGGCGGGGCGGGCGG